jgi:hypothetical protein
VWQQNAAAGNVGGRAAIQATAQCAQPGWSVMQDPKDSGPSGAGCLVRIYWMLFGNALQLFLLATIVSKRPRFPSVSDAIYWLIVVSLILARYVDIRYQNGKTAYGDGAFS